MKIVGSLSEDLIKQTENRYENIWVSFSLIMSLCGLLLIPHYKFVKQASINLFMTVFSVCIVYFMVVSFVKLFKNHYEDKTLRILDSVGIVVGSIAAYSLCAAACLIVGNAI